MRASIVLALLIAAGAASAQTTTPTAEEVAANTAKANAEARKAQAEADLAALKARMASDVVPPYTGAIIAGANTGTVEGYVLAADAVKGAARVIVARVKESGSTAVLLMASAEIPTFNSLIGFGLSSTVFDEGYRDAKKAQEELDRSPPPGTRPAPPPPAVPPVAGTIFGLDALNRMLGFFRSDYSMNGMNIEFDDSILLHALAGELTKQGVDTFLPVQFNQPALDIANSPILKTFRSIAEKRAEAVVRAAANEKSYNDADTQAKAATGALKKPWEEYARRHKEVWEKWKGLIALFDSQFAKLGVPDEKGILPIAVLVKEAAIKEVLQQTGARLLIAKSQKSGGSYYTKKNLWTSLGAMPFFAAGGTVASFVLYQGDTGKVLAAGAVPIHGGYKRVDKIEQNFRPPPDTP